MANEHRDLLGRDLLAVDGARLGHIADVYVDPESGAPKWLVVPGGVFSSGVSFVPAEGAGEDEDGRIVTAYTRKQVRKAPHPDADGDLSPTEEQQLARHYLAVARMNDSTPSRDVSSDATVETNLAAVTDDDDATDQWLVDPGPSDDSMVRAEEELHVASTARPAQRARLVKRVVTEEVTLTVPVRREVLHVAYEDIGEDEPFGAGENEPFVPTPDSEIVLYAEIVEYEKKVVAKERVRLQKEVVEEALDLRADLRKEAVEVVDADPTPTLH